MLRVIFFLVAVAIAATGLSWLADRPGSLVVNWQGYEVETSVFRATVMLAFLVGLSILAWSILTALWRSPASVGAFFNRRRQMRGLEALSGGMIAIGSGDRAGATRYAVQARKALPNEPLTQLLRAQAAQLSGDRATARRMFEAMIAAPETEQLGLRGLFLEAQQEGEREAARQFAERSVELNPRLPWAVDALFELQCKEKDWAGALETLNVAKKHQHHDKGVLDRRRAVLMTARAMALEETDPNRAMNLAVEAHHLARDLVPAGALAGRMLAARGHTKRATKIIERAWRQSPHPDLALVYAHARLGDSPRDRLDRVKRLAQANPHSLETPIAIATAAIEARDFDIARRALEPLDAGRMTQRVCMLMARIEGEEHGDKGRVREWLARAVHAPRDPCWVADGVATDRWAPVSPVTGAFDAFQWRVPIDALDAADTDLLAAKLEQIVRLGAPAAVEPTALPEVDVRKPVAASAAPAAMRPVVTPVGAPVGSSADNADRAGATAVPRREPPSRQAEDVAAVTVTGAAASAARVAREDAQRPEPRQSEPRQSEPRAANSEGRRTASVDVVVRGKEEAEVQVTKPPVLRKPLEPSVFITPRAPDDPGVKPKDETGERPKTPPLSVVNGKR